VSRFFCLRPRPLMWIVSARRSSSVVERTLGKGEVGSSILPCGTIFGQRRAETRVCAARTLYHAKHIRLHHAAIERLGAAQISPIPRVSRVPKQTS
jgi:hypothetical protein